MSDLDAYEKEMGRFSQLEDPELAAFSRELEDAFRTPPDGETETRHLTAIMDAVRLQPAADAPPSAATAQRRSRRRGAWSSRPTRVARAAFAAAVALGAFCGVAYAGALPGPVQGAVADVARNVGVSLPGAHNNKDDGAQNDTNDGAQNDTPAAPQASTNPEAGTGGQSGQSGNQDTGGAQQNESHGAQNGKNRAEQNQNTNGGSGTQGAGSNDSNDAGGAQQGVGPIPPSGQAGVNQDGGTPGDGNQGNGDN